MNKIYKQGDRVGTPMGMGWVDNIEVYNALTGNKEQDKAQYLTEYDFDTMPDRGFARVGVKLDTPNPNIVGNAYFMEEQVSKYVQMIMVTS